MSTENNLFETVNPNSISSSLSSTAVSSVNNKRCKFIVVTGGVMSGLGKGVVAASVGRLLASSRKVVPIKCDGYLNVDPGTMNPTEHGEVFVLEDGGEVDLDFGHYERFLNLNCKFGWNLTSGKVFREVIERERRGGYLGKTVQMIPHVTDLIKEKWRGIADEEDAEVILIEIGGTIGDIENMLFLEAARQLRQEEGLGGVAFIHLTYVPVVGSSLEPKTKPTQQSVAALRQIGIQPDLVIARSSKFLDQTSKEKIALFASLSPSQVLSDPDLDSVYELPIIFHKEGLLDVLSSHFNEHFQANIENWTSLVDNIKFPRESVTVAICGKYTSLHDSYMSVVEALVHAGANNATRVNIKFLETTEVENNPLKISEFLKGVDGIIVPGGFGDRGIEGKVEIIKFARENNIPFLGLCYGLQLAVIEFARNVCQLHRANSKEIAESDHTVIELLPDQENIQGLGGTMEIGNADNAILNFMEHVIFPVKGEKGENFVITRDEKYGGNLEYPTFKELEEDFSREKLHPMDMKSAFTDEINKLLAPIQKDKKIFELHKAAYE